jgi:uncharacterized membrane protein YhiD involved in acid resistance
MACGMGYWKGAVAATLLVLVATFLFGKIESAFLVESHYKKFVVTSKDAPGLLARIQDILKKYGITTKQIGLHQDFQAKMVQITATGPVPETCDFEALLREIDAVAEVEKVEVE